MDCELLIAAARGAAVHAGPGEQGRGAAARGAAGGDRARHLRQPALHRRAEPRPAAGLHVQAGQAVGIVVGLGAGLVIRLGVGLVMIMLLVQEGEEYPQGRGLQQRQHQEHPGHHRGADQRGQ